MPAGPAFFKIATTTLTGTANRVDFTNLGTYTDLILVCSYTTSNDLFVTINGDQSGIYTTTGQNTNGSTLATNRLGNAYISPFTISGQATSIFEFFGWQNTSNFRTFYGYHGNPSGSNNQHLSSTYRTTNAYTSINVWSNGSLQANSTFSLYGISAA